MSVNGKFDGIMKGRGLMNVADRLPIPGADEAIISVINAVRGWTGFAM